MLGIPAQGTIEPANSAHAAEFLDGVKSILEPISSISKNTIGHIRGLFGGMASMVTSGVGAIWTKLGFLTGNIISGSGALVTKITSIGEHAHQSIHELLTGSSSDSHNATASHAAPAAAHGGGHH